MLKTPSDFPHAGSFAMLDGVKVRIIRVEPDGNRFVSGKGIARTVPLDRLIALEEAKPAIQLWADQRIIAVGGGVITPAGDVFGDYCAWFARVLPADSQVQRHAFDRALLKLGFRTVRAPVAGRMSRCWAFALSEGKRSAAA